MKSACCVSYKHLYWSKVQARVSAVVLAHWPLYSLVEVCCFFHWAAFYKQHSLLPNNWPASVAAICTGGRSWARWAGASLARWHSDVGEGHVCWQPGVSRSVRLSVCEALIRFQDFPSVTGLLTKPCTTTHGETRRLTPSKNHSLLEPKQSLAGYTSAGCSTVTWNHTQHPSVKFLQLLTLVRTCSPKINPIFENHCSGNGNSLWRHTPEALDSNYSKTMWY